MTEAIEQPEDGERIPEAKRTLSRGDAAGSSDAMSRPPVQGGSGASPLVTAPTLLATIVVLLALATAVRAGDGTGIASMWQGPGAATHDCVYPWTSCATRAVQSLETGVTIIVTPTMYCDCYVGRTGPNGETERLIDLDPGQVRALGLDPADGLWGVRVWLVNGAGLPNTAAR